ncbi:transposable element Tcb1 transposase [Trichonephila clavipes]|nr:transposable element Tcb1 transposase [Trichonephila clavipes]
MAQRKHLDDFLRGRIIERLKFGRTQLEVSKKLGIAQSVISRFGNDYKRMVINRRSTTSDLSRQLSSATGTTVSRQTVYTRLWHIGLYARRHVRCVPLAATHSHLRLTWSREHALWTPQQWSCVMFSDDPRFSLQTDLHVQSVTLTGHIYREVILEQHVRLFRGAMYAELLFMDDNSRPHRANIVDECLQSENISRRD